MHSSPSSGAEHTNLESYAAAPEKGYVPAASVKSYVLDALEINKILQFCPR